MSNKVRYLPKALEVAHVMTCTRIMGEMAGCNDEQIRSAVELAKNLFLYKKNSKGNAICRAVKVARSRKRDGIGVVKDNVLQFTQTNIRKNLRCHIHHIHKNRRNYCLD